MASVYPRYDKVPIPEGAEVFTRKGKKMIRYTDRRGHKREYPQDQDNPAMMLVQRRHWYVAWTDEHMVRQTKRGFRDYEASEALGRKLEQQAERKQAGLPVVDTDKIMVSTTKAVELYLVDVERLGRSQGYRANVRCYLERLMKDCSWATPSALRADDMLRWLADFKRAGNAASTANHYLECSRRFLDWCCRNGYADHNPLATVDKADTRIPKRVRRAEPAERLRTLLGVSVASGRAVVYLTAMKTGLRRKELKCLQWGDVVLTGSMPHVQLRAGDTKARRGDTIPIDAELAEVLRGYRPADAKETDRVFRAIPTMDTYRIDLERAGIPYVDQQGRVFDFHSLRKSYNMLLAKSGAQPRVAQELMRHKDIRETMGVYTDPRLLDLQGAVDRLPRLVLSTTDPTGGENQPNPRNGGASGAAREEVS